MTIDEAIKHAKDKAKEQRKDYDTCVVKEGYGCKDCAYYYSKSCIECAEEHEQLAEWLEELKEYKQLEEQGLLLKLPYDIANRGKVYFVDEDDLEIYELLADKIEIYKMMISELFVYTIDNFEFLYEDFGKIVFLTKEEAEAKLKELESE